MPPLQCLGCADIKHLSEFTLNNSSVEFFVGVSGVILNDPQEIVLPGSSLLQSHQWFGLTLADGPQVSLSASAPPPVVITTPWLNGSGVSTTMGWSRAPWDVETMLFLGHPDTFGTSVLDMLCTRWCINPGTGPVANIMGSSTCAIPAVGSFRCRSAEWSILSLDDRDCSMAYNWRRWTITLRMSLDVPGSKEKDPSQIQ